MAELSLGGLATRAPILDRLLTLMRQIDLLHIATLVTSKQARLLFQCNLEHLSRDTHLINQSPNQENFFPPTLFEITQLSQLQEEVFGPVLHLIRYQNLDQVIAQIKQCPYGLTLAIHSRIAKRAQALALQLAVGNIYINRNSIGARVGSQPFGGCKLSGTGPKAGGPLYFLPLQREPLKAVKQQPLPGIHQQDAKASSHIT